MSSYTIVTLCSVYAVTPFRNHIATVTHYRLSLPYEGNVVTVNNLAESGAPHMACLPAADTAASVAIRNAVPCISSTYVWLCAYNPQISQFINTSPPKIHQHSPTYEDVVAAFDAKHQCGVVITIPIGSRPSHALTPSGVRTQSGPAIAALSVGYAAGQPVSEADLLTASNLAARMSPYVNVLLASFLPELMRDCACHADDACAPGAGVGAGDGNEPPGAGTSCTVNNKRAELPPLECLEPLLMLDTVRRNGRSSLSSRRPSSNNTVVLHPLWTAAWFNMRQHGRPMTSQLASSMLQSLTLNDNEKIGDHGRGLDAEDVLAPRQGAAVGQPNDLAGYGVVRARRLA